MMFGCPTVTDMPKDIILEDIFGYDGLAPAPYNALNDENKGTCSAETSLWQYKLFEYISMHLTVYTGGLIRCTNTTFSGNINEIPLKIMNNSGLEHNFLMKGNTAHKLIIALSL
jgi:hypothetical protein